MIKEQIVDRLRSLTPLFGPMCCSAIPRKDCRGVLPPETKAQHTAGHITEDVHNPKDLYYITVTVDKTKTLFVWE